MKSSQNGNVLFLILIAVALFAALSYAVTNSSRTSGQSDREASKLTVSQIMQYGTDLQLGVTRAIIINKCDLSQLSFHPNGRQAYHSSFTSGYVNANAPPDKRCHIFEPEGGGVIYQPIIPNADVISAHEGSNHDVYTSYHIAHRGGVAGIGAQPVDLLMVISNVTDEICKAYNKEAIGQSTIPATTFWGGWSSTFAGTIVNTGGSNPNVPAMGMSDTPELYGQVTGCVLNTGNSLNSIYYVIREL